MKINMSVIGFAGGLLLQAGVALWWAAGIGAQVNVNTANTIEMREEISQEVQETRADITTLETRIADRLDMEAARIASIEVAQGDLREAFATINAKLDALIERFDRAERSGRQNE